MDDQPTKANHEPFESDILGNEDTPVAPVLDEGRMEFELETIDANSVDLESVPAAPWLTTLEAHQRIGKNFEILRRIGAGGMGAVYLARDLRLGRRVAVKTILTTRFYSPERRTKEFAQFRRDAAATAQLQHPNIVTVHEFGIDEELDIPFIVLEYLRGESLAEKLERQGRIELEEALDCMLHVAEALDHAHASGVVHRDLKPGNIFLTDDQRVKVLDFGVALMQAERHELQERFALSEAELESYLGEHPVVAGTPVFMAPEQAMGSDQDARVDVWACGVILSYFLTGRLPFRTAFAAALGKRADLRVSNPEIPSAVVELIDDCLEVDTSNRIADAATLRTRLAEILASRSVDEIDLDPERELTNFQPPVDRFIGRAPELVAITRIFEHGARLLTLLGPGGVGKTRLATEYGWRERQRWPGGVWCCDLSEAHDIEQVASAIAEAIGVPLTSGEPLDQLDSIFAARGRALWILDNYEQLAGLSEQTLTRWLGASRDACFLVTSRVRLGCDAEKILEAAPMDGDRIEEAVELFVERAKAQKARFNPVDPETRASLRELVVLLDGLPLAIELAAARSRVLSPKKMLLKMTRRFELLRAKRSGALARQATLRGAIDWSWQLLEPAYRCAMAQLSVFHGGFSLEAAEDIVELDEFGDAFFVNDMLRKLTHHSLLRRVPGHTDRFAMLVSIAEFARDRLSEPEDTWPSFLEEELRERYVAFFAGYGTREACEELHGSVMSLRSWAQDLDNLLGAVEVGLAEDMEEDAAFCAVAAAEFIEMRGPFNRGIVLLERLVKPEIDAEIDGRVELQLARLRWRAGEPDAAIEQLESILERAPKRYDALHAEVKMYLGILLGETSKEQRALELLSASFINTQLSVRLRAVAGFNLAILEQHRGNLDSARALHEEAREMADSVGAQRVVAMTFANSGVLAFLQGRESDCRADLERALTSFRLVGDRRSEGAVLGNLAVLALKQGRKTDAERGMSRALELARSLGDRRTEGITLGNLADVHRQSGRLDEALQGIERALQISIDMHDMRWQGYWESLSGEVLEELGRREDALGAYDRAIALYESTYDIERLARTHGRRGISLARAGLREQAGEALEAARFAQAQLDSGSDSELAGVLDRLVSELEQVPAPE